MSTPNYNLVDINGQKCLVNPAESGEDRIHAHLHSDMELKEAERYLVFCSGDNSVVEVCTLEKAHEVAREKVAQWNGSAIYPWVTIARAQETYEVF